MASCDGKKKYARVHREIKRTHHGHLTPFASLSRFHFFSCFGNEKKKTKTVREMREKTQEQPGLALWYYTNS